MATSPPSSTGASKNSNDKIVDSDFNDALLDDLEFDPQFLDEPPSEAEETGDVSGEATPAANEAAKKAPPPLLSVKPTDDISAGFLEDDDLIEDDLVRQPPPTVAYSHPQRDEFSEASALTELQPSLPPEPAMPSPQPFEPLYDTEPQSPPPSQAAAPPEQSLQAPTPQSPEQSQSISFEIDEAPPEPETKAISTPSPFETFQFEPEASADLYQFGTTDEAGSLSKTLAPDPSLEDIFSGLNTTPAPPPQKPVAQTTANQPTHNEEEADVIPTFVFEVAPQTDVHEPVIAEAPTQTIASEPESLIPNNTGTSAPPIQSDNTQAAVFPELTPPAAPAANADATVTLPELYPAPPPEPQQPETFAPPAKVSAISEPIVQETLDKVYTDSTSELSLYDDLEDTPEEIEPVPDDNFFATLDTSFAGIKSAATPPPKPSHASKPLTTASKKPLYAIVKANAAAKASEDTPKPNRPAATYNFELSHTGGQHLTIDNFVPAYDSVSLTLGHMLFNIRADGAATVLLFGNGDKLTLGDETHPVSPNAALRSIILKS